MQRLWYAVVVLIVSAQLTVAAVVVVREHRARHTDQTFTASAFIAPSTPTAISPIVTATSSSEGLATTESTHPTSAQSAPLSASPANAAPAAASTASAAPTLSPPAAPASTAAAGQATATPGVPVEPLRYTVLPGDSLTMLAARFNVPEGILAALNDLDPTARLAVGQLLYVPPQGYARDK